MGDVAEGAGGADGADAAGGADGADAAESRFDSGLTNSIRPFWTQMLGAGGLTDIPGSSDEHRVAGIVPRGMLERAAGELGADSDDCRALCGLRGPWPLKTREANTSGSRRPPSRVFRPPICVGCIMVGIRSSADDDGTTAPPDERVSGHLQNKRRQLVTGTCHCHKFWNKRGASAKLRITRLLTNAFQPDNFHSIAEIMIYQKSFKFNPIRLEVGPQNRLNVGEWKSDQSE